MTLELESKLMGDIRKLREALWNQLRRPSTKTRERAFAVLDQTANGFSECPGDQPSIYLDTHTIEMCARWCDDVIDERQNPERGDPENPIPLGVDVDTVRWIADHMRIELPDSSGPDIEDEALCERCRPFVTLRKGGAR